MPLGSCAPTRYFSLFADQEHNASATEAPVQFDMPADGTVSNLYIRLSANAGAAGSSYTFTVRKNGAATAVTCTAAGATATCSDTTNSATFAAGDLISIHATPSAGTQPTDNLEVRSTAKFNGT